MDTLYNCTLDEKGVWFCPLEEKCSNLTCGANGSLADVDEACLMEEDYLKTLMGPRRSSMFFPVCLTYMVIFVVGVVGNLLTCSVIARNKMMWTPTNYYLFSLAVSDLLVLLLGMPLELYELWQNYPFLLGSGGCYFKTFLFETVCLASILNVTALSMERYIAVVHPLAQSTCNPHPRSTGHPGCMGRVGLVCAAEHESPRDPGPPASLQQRHRKLQHGNPRLGHLHASEAALDVQPDHTGHHFVVFCPAHAHHHCLLHAHWAAVEAGEDATGAGSKIGTRTGQLLQHPFTAAEGTSPTVILVVVFAICWAPFHTDRLMWSFISDWTANHHEIFQYVHIISGVLFYISSAVNPILYNLMSTRFREMFKEVMCHRAHHS
ncbi:unnamed protein product, partial [Tetraodon nigroviridis]